jgi:hypothetical protein
MTPFFVQYFIPCKRLYTFRVKHVLWGVMLVSFWKLIFLSYLVYQGSLNYIIYFYFPILKELIIYISHCFISINNRLLVVKC